MNILEIYSIHDEITLLMRESIMRIISIGNVVFFSYWLIFGIIFFWITFGSLYKYISSIFLIIWLLGICITIIPGLFDSVIFYLLDWITLRGHKKIIAKIEREFYDSEGIDDIRGILNTSKRLYSIVKNIRVISYIILYIIFALEIVGLKKMNTHSYGELPMDWESACSTIQSKKHYFFALLEKSHIYEVNMILYLLTDLRSDLTSRLSEQQQILESAKSEVENNIQGTTELKQVSEAQKLRLDRQIEQFEELQRVLMKV